MYLNKNLIFRLFLIRSTSVSPKTFTLRYLCRFSNFDAAQPDEPLFSANWIERQQIERNKEHQPPIKALDVVDNAIYLKLMSFKKAAMSDLIDEYKEAFCTKRSCHCNHHTCMCPPPFNIRMFDGLHYGSFPQIAQSLEALSLSFHPSLDAHCWPYKSR